MKKIVQLSAIDGTMNKGLKNLNRTLIKNGYNVIGICSSGPNSDEIKNDGVHLININIDRKIGLTNLKTIYQLIKEFKKTKPDIVHVHTPIAGVLARIAAKMARVPNIIYTAHGFYFHENMKPTKYNIYFYIEKIMAKYFTDYLFTQSQEDADLAMNKNFMPKGKILCIGNGVDVKEEFNPNHIVKEEVENLYKEFNLSEKDTIVTFVGRLVREKGIFELLEAFKKNENSNLKLLIVGSSGQSERDTEAVKKLKAYQNIKNIIFTGRRSDVNNILKISDIFCLPSYREGMPRSIIEAMSMENAVIATNIRGSREEVIHGKTGYLIPLYDSESILSSIKKLTEDKELLENMKNEGRRRAQRLYNEDVVVAKQLNVFEKLLQEN